MAEPVQTAADDARQAVIALHGELENLLAQLDAEAYAAVPADCLGATGSIGAHLRHCLDHLRALLDGVETGLVAYDRRERGTAIEHRPEAGLARLRELVARLRELPAAALAEPVRVEVTVAADRPMCELPSSIGRELAFVFSHTIHHNAIIGMQAQALGYSVPAALTHAPSTLAHLEQRGCAPGP